MNLRFLRACLPAAAIGTCGLAAGEQPCAYQAGDLKPPRREKTEAPLADRCRAMLDVQVAVYRGTRDLHNVVQAPPGGELLPEHLEASRKLAARQKALAARAAKVIPSLQAEGAAPAFSQVFEEARKDMERVRLRLERGDIGAGTQAVERDIIETFRDLLASLKKG